MIASIYNPTTKKTVSGHVYSRGLGKITLVVTDNNGSRSIKSFNEQKWIVTINS